MSLSTPEEWAEAYATLSRERAGRSHLLFPIVLGIDHAEAMADYFATEARDTIENIYPHMWEAGMRQGMTPMQSFQSAVATLLATEAQTRLEFGLWLAQTGRVKP